MPLNIQEQAKSLAVFVSEKSTEFTYHRCRYRDTEKQRPSASEKHKAATKLCTHLWETKEGGLAETAGICSDLLLWHQRGIGSESLSAFFGCCISKSE